MSQLDLTTGDCEALERILGKQKKDGNLVLQSLQACLRLNTRILALAFMSPSNVAFLFPLQLLSLPGPLRANTMKQGFTILCVCVCESEIMSEL